MWSVSNKPTRLRPYGRLTPGYHDSTNPDSRTEILEKNVRGKLHEDVGYKEHSYNSAVSDSFQIELFDDVVRWFIIVESSGISKVDSVKVVDQIGNTDPWQDVQVNLANNSSLDLKTND